MQVIDPAHAPGAEVTCIAVSDRGTCDLAAVVDAIYVDLCWCQVAAGNDIMATGGTDHAIRIWDLRMAKMLQECSGHSGKVRTCRWLVPQQCQHVVTVVCCFSGAKPAFQPG